MILTGPEIEREVNAGNIVLSPFDSDHINPNSYDLCLGPHLLRYTNPILDPSLEQPVEEMIIPSNGLVLRSGSLQLGSSIEVVGSGRYVPMLHAKSGIARLGLFVHITADLIDIGSFGNLTFQLHPTIDVRVYAGMRLAQASFWTVKGDVKLYSGKYQNSRGPQKSKSFMDKFWTDRNPGQGNADEP